MNKKDVSYRIPEGFNPYLAMDAVRGLTDAIHQVLLEGPGTEIRIPTGDKLGLNALVDLLQEHVHALHEYFMELENATAVDLPMTNEELDAIRIGRGKNEVREDAPLYVVK